MEALGLAEFDQQSDKFDTLVAATPDIDHFCSASDWIVPAARALMPPRTPFLFRRDDCQIALMRGYHPDGWPYLEPLEAMWGLACPVVGPRGTETARYLAETLAARASDWRVVVLTGLPQHSRMFGDIVRQLKRYELMQGPSTTRCVASLQGGLDGFLSRRSRNFRKALRRALRDARDAGLEFSACHSGDIDQAKNLYERVVAVEFRSWKGRAGMGIESGGMYHFYREMVPRLARRGALKLIFARDLRRGGGADVGYVLGGIFGDTYRGLQFSFDSEYRHLALGNLCQYQQIVELCDEGIQCYDLGTDMEYKRRWAETFLKTVGLIALRR